MPHATPCVRVEGYERLREQVVALSLAAVPVVARRPEREIDEPAPDVDGERRPHVRVAHARPRAVLPCLVAELAWLRDRIEAPDATSRSYVEGLYVARWIALVHEAVADTVADDDEISIHDRRRRVRVMLLLDAPENVRGEIHLAIRAERWNGTPGRGVERDETPPARDEDATLFAVAPRRDASVNESGAVRWLPRYVCLRVVGPELASRRRVERDDAVVRRREEERVADREWRHLKLPGTGGDRQIGRAHV